VTREGRIARIRAGRWIRYPVADRIADRLEALLASPRVTRMPNLLIVGDPNNGKTALIERFVRHHPALGGTSPDTPVLAVEAPPVPDERRLYQAILRRLGTMSRPSWAAARLQWETLRALVAFGVRMLVIDDVQRALAGPPAKQRQLLNAIEHLGSELQIPIVAAGTPDASNAIHADPQFAYRFDRAVLPRWTMSSDYLRLLASFEIALPLEHRSALAKSGLAVNILSRSEGTIGEISALLCGAALAAIERGTERITAVELDRCGYLAPSERRRLALAL